MFWARTAALRPFFDAQLVLEDFSPDTSGRQLDGTMAHAIERLIFVAAERAGFSWVKVAQPHLFERKDTIKTIHDPAELRAFIAQQRRILSVLASDKMGNFVDLHSPEFDPVRVLSTPYDFFWQAFATPRGEDRTSIRAWTGHFCGCIKTARARTRSIGQLVDVTVPIRLTQTPTRYRTPSSDGGKRTRKQFLVSD